MTNRGGVVTRRCRSAKGGVGVLLLFILICFVSVDGDITTSIYRDIARKINRSGIAIINGVIRPFIPTDTVTNARPALLPGAILHRDVTTRDDGDVTDLVVVIRGSVRDVV